MWAGWYSGENATWLEAWLSESTAVLTTWATLDKQGHPTHLFLSAGARGLAKSICRGQDGLGSESVK